MFAWALRTYGDEANFPASWKIKAATAVVTSQNIDLSPEKASKLFQNASNYTKSTARSIDASKQVLQDAVKLDKTEISDNDNTAKDVQMADLNSTKPVKVGNKISL